MNFRFTSFQLNYEIDRAFGWLPGFYMSRNNWCITNRKSVKPFDVLFRAKEQCATNDQEVETTKTTKYEFGFHFSDAKLSFSFVQNSIRARPRFKNKMSAPPFHASCALYAAGERRNDWRRHGGQRRFTRMAVESESAGEFHRRCHLRCAGDDLVLVVHLPADGRPARHDLNC